MMNCQNPMTLYQLCIIMHVEPSGFDFIYNGNEEAVATEEATYSKGYSKGINAKF